MQNDFDPEEKKFEGAYLGAVNGSEAQRFPNNCIGVLYTKNRGELMMLGTGFLVTCNLVATVAHNLYSRKEKIEIKELYFYPGICGQLHPRESYKVRSYRFPEEYKSCSKEEVLKYDYALLKIERKVIRDSYIELGVNYVQLKEKLCVIGYGRTSCNG
jgi:V8-like Glu-specific endopeptidase